MFTLVEMKDTVRVPPWRFKTKLNQAVEEALNMKLANKVVHNVGLCISLWDITEIADSYIFPGDGSSHTIVKFRYVVFRPFMDEILVGKIRSSSKEGVHVSLGFFDDILIPSDAMQHPSRFDEAEQLWVWKYDTGEGSHDLFMDIGEEVRFRVVDETFVDTSPTGPESSSSGVDGAETQEVTAEKKSPFTLIGAVSEPGLGLLTWWNNT
ncbi:hypothetical protein CAPTEDRAFT_156703 [Capitella teleta]|uniref:DNA-directed RNA polymerase III subunit RPC8 n=1 Tax=Capitella teleta TaxID=283909 RepID=R7VB25_CAPTE|nr:hypothetical protein CAPTEDRAFT_156703 [Capitella teleta]|eukprot:ELU15722.1 hypothetical protein CAPTEDRAFT_156703 [Capitella teleta]